MQLSRVHDSASVSTKEITNNCVLHGSERQDTIILFAHIYLHEAHNYCQKVIQMRF